MSVTSWMDQTGERGAIAPIFALILVILLIFAALTTDLGAAWAVRRTAQATVDAAVMAAATEYLRLLPPDEEKGVDEDRCGLISSVCVR